MKKKIFFFLMTVIGILIGLTNSCKKEKPGNSSIGIAKSFTEEFDSIYELETKGWVITDNSEQLTLWTGWISKIGPITPPFPAYSYSVSEREFIRASVSGSSSYYPVSSWLITPVLSVKNGDKISFYTRADTGSVYRDRLQVLMNMSLSSNVGGTVNSTGNFNTVLFDINSGQVAGGYPVTWTKYEYTFSGISGRADTRIGFRYFVPSAMSAKMIGIDLFQFTSN
ncbi:MAG: choice-of-anchor J domain-containing protein [Chitinophagaceae bacterium]|nr:choice-of-anchor J domain-containing protein [Chitinophagaceae bacterium]